MRTRVRVIEPGTLVRIRRPQAGERGVWRVTGRVAGRKPEDPAYDVQHTGHGRTRVLKEGRLQVLRPRRTHHQPMCGSAEARP